METSKEQKEAIEYLEKYTKWETYGERNLEKDIMTVLELLKETQRKLEIVNDYNYWVQLAVDRGIELENLQKENEKYKRLAKINLENAEEFKDNMCEHRCLLKSENEELKEDLKYVLNQTLGAFEKNWCIDYNFTEIREKYNLESE